MSNMFILIAVFLMLCAIWIVRQIARIRRRDYLGEQSDKRDKTIAPPPEFPKAKQDERPASGYPKFIPFYEWHGFWNGLHWENKLFCTSKGKLGRHPENFDDATLKILMTSPKK